MPANRDYHYLDSLLSSQRFFCLGVSSKWLNSSSSRPQRGVPTTPACTWWNRAEEDLSSGKLESTHPSMTVVKSIVFFMESSQLYAATLTHYSTEPLTTGPDYDPLLLYQRIEQLLLLISILS